MHGSSACFGTRTKSTTAFTADQPAEQNPQRKRGDSLSEKDFWTSSSNEMGKSAINSRTSQKSVSSIIGSHQNMESQESNSTKNTKFENHALELWNERRKEWIGSRRRLKREPRTPVLSWIATYDELLGTSRPFPQRIPLPEMVDFLVDVWEQEGLYD